MSNDTVKATVYLQVQPEYASWISDHSKPESVIRAKVVRSTQKRSQTPEAGTVEVKAHDRAAEDRIHPAGSGGDRRHPRVPDHTSPHRGRGFRRERGELTEAGY